MTTALCVGKWELFDSTDIRDHDRAAKLCAACPVLHWCRTERVRAIAEQRKSGMYGIAGTWAGRLYGPTQINPGRIKTEDDMFTDDEARTAHAAWGRGVRNDRVRIGERVYQRRAKQRKKAVA